MKTVIGVYDTFSRTQDAVQALLLRKYDRADISVIASESSRTRPGEEEAGSTTPGATSAAGGVLGVLAGAAALSIPGFGPILAAGPMLGVLTAATAAAATDDAGLGGLVAALQQIGAPEDDARMYAEAVRRGSALVIVRTPPHLADRVAALLRDLGHVDIERVRRRAVPGNYPEGGLGGDRPADRGDDDDDSGRSAAE